MKFRNIFWGIILILIGVLFILQNLNIIDFRWVSLWRLWPVFLILWGVSILPANNWIKTSLIVIVLAGSVYFMLNRTVAWRDYSPNIHIGRNYDDYDDDEVYNDEGQADQYFNIPFEDSVATASLNFDAAAGSFYINDTSDDLLTFSKKGRTGTYTYYVKSTNDNANITIEREGQELFLNNNNTHHNVDISLNQAPEWNMNFDIGAAKVNFDLSQFKLKKLDLDGGAASIKIKLGDKLPKSHVNIDAGASEIVLRVPQSAGCDLNLNAVLSGKTISGFEKVDNGHYRTSNFDESDNKIFITVDAAVSSYKITRY